MVGAGRAASVDTVGQPIPSNRSVRRPWSGRPLAVLAAALLMAGSGGCAVLAEIPGQAAPVDPARPPAGPLDGDAPLTQGDLAQVSAEQLLDESLVAQFTQPSLRSGDRAGAAGRAAGCRSES